MSEPDDLTIEATSALSQGARNRQEDAVATWFPQGSSIGFSVLSDGMGGHKAGDVASQVIVTEVFAELSLRLTRQDYVPAAIPGMLRTAALIANECLKTHIKSNPDCSDMGGTVLIIVVVHRQLYWLSVGDSPLYLYRGGRLSQLNADHSLAPQIDHMVAQGLMNFEAAQNHPQRNCLTSALTGGDIAEIDCPQKPLCLLADDVIISASDGLQFIPDDAINGVLTRVNGKPTTVIADALMSAVAAVNDPDQDNVSMAVLSVRDSAEAVRNLRNGAAAGGAFKALRSAIPLLAEYRR